MDALSLLLCAVGISPVPVGIPSSAGRHLLRDGPSHCQGQERLILVQERTYRVWLYVSHSAVLILCLSAKPWSALHFHPPEHRFIGAVPHLGSLGSLSGHPLLGFYGMISPASPTWYFLNKGPVLGASHVGFCQLHHRGSCHAAHPAWPSWHQQPRSFSKKNLCWPPGTPGQTVSY